MMILTAKVDLKKILLILLAVSAVLLVVISAFGVDRSAQTAAPAMSANESRVKFLESFGWQVKNTPAESGQVRIPEPGGEVFDRYNLLQKGQGYDLSAFAGKKVMRYVYTVTNYPGAKEPVYATLLVHKNKVIGGDITDTALQGKICGFRMPTQTAPAPTAAPEQPAPSATNEASIS